MRHPTLCFATSRLSTWLMPFLLCIGLASCGGGNSEDAMTSNSPTGTTDAATILAAISPTSLDQQKQASENDAGLFLTAGNIDGPDSINSTEVAVQFDTPFGIAADTAGNIYVTDTDNSTIRKITAAGVVTTLAGTAGVTGSADGSGAAAQFFNPIGIAGDAVGNLYVADTYNSTIRKITAAGMVTTLAGIAGVTGNTGGSGAAAQFFYPFGIAADTANNLYVADTSNHAIRKITLGSMVTTVAR